MGAVLVLVRVDLDEFWRSIGKYLERVRNKMIDGTNLAISLTRLLLKIYSFEVARKTVSI